MLHSLEGKYRGRFRVSSTRFDGFSQPSAPTLSPLRNENAAVPTPTAPTRSPTFHPRFLQLDRSPLPARRIRSRPHSLGEVALLRAGGGLQSTESAFTPTRVWRSCWTSVFPTNWKRLATNWWPGT